jgi:hypothetical protein
MPTRLFSKSLLAKYMKHAGLCMPALAWDVIPNPEVYSLQNIISFPNITRQEYSAVLGFLIFRVATECPVFRKGV